MHRARSDRRRIRRSRPSRFTLDGREVEAAPGETIWQVAAAQRDRRSRTSATRPSPAIGPTATAAPAWSRSRASACWPPRASAGRRPGMKVTTDSDRADRPAQMVFELLLADQPRARDRPRPRLEVLELGRPDRRRPRAGSRRRRAPAPDLSHPAMAVQLDACIHCDLCVRACREVQVNDVIGMACRGPSREDRLRLRRPDGREHLRRLRRVRPGLPDRRPDARVGARRAGQKAPTRPTARSTASARTAASAASSPSRSRTTASLAVDGRDGPANHNRLCVKGRFGFDYVHHPDRLTVPLIRKAGVPEARRRPGRSRPTPGPTSARRPGTRRSTSPPPGLRAIRDRDGGAGAGGLRLGQGVERGGVPVPEAGADRLRQQQRRPLHAALPRLVGRRPDGDDRLGRGDGAVRRVRRLPT